MTRARPCRYRRRNRCHGGLCRLRRGPVMGRRSCPAGMATVQPGPGRGQLHLTGGPGGGVPACRRQVQVPPGQVGQDWQVFRVRLAPGGVLPAAVRRQDPEETFWREGLAYASVEDLCHHLSIGLEEFEALLAYSNAEETRLFVLRESCGGRPRWLARATPKRIRPDRRGGRGGFYDAVPVQPAEGGRPSNQPPSKKRRQDRSQGAGQPPAGPSASSMQQGPVQLQALIEAFAQSLPEHLVELPRGSSATARAYRGGPQPRRSRGDEDRHEQGGWQ